ncbi:MAG TPA: hypothetical protein VFK32_05825 [Tepidiformaceae bacterium]|nr:hypothetical protein [Tepidiformaceae bacterium]
MPAVDPPTAAAYRQAWDEWQKQLEHLHRVLLEGEPLPPERFKGLLNREVRAKERYDAARLQLLGIEDEALAIPTDGSNPFR